MQDKNKIVEKFIKERVGQGIIDAFGDGISIQDTDLNILYQNSAHKEIIGDHQGEICYRAYEKREEICDGCPVVKSFLDGEAHTTERTATTDKGIIIVEITASPLRDSDGIIIAGIEIVRDITERKRIETSVKENEQKYSNLFNYSNDAIFIHDLDGNIFDVNKQCMNIFGYSKSELLKLHVMELHPPSALEIAKSAFKTIIKKGFVNFEIEFRKKDGTIFIADVSSSIFKVGGRQVIQGIVRDITERKKAEEELNKRAKHLEELNDLFLNRELKMIELKNEIKELKKRDKT
jgi:PAS domain S-box-containing protein